MVEIKAHRLSEGNRMFPCKIILEDCGMTVKIPSFFSSKETFISYSDISSISIDTPFIGYSTIKFNTKGQKIEAHGFTKSDAQKIQKRIQYEKNKMKK